MKNGLVFILVATMLTSFGVLDRNISYVEDEEIEDLLNQRIDILNEYLYKEKDFDKLKTELMQIETGQILEKDMETMAYIKDNPTDLNLTKYVNVVKINNCQNINGEIQIQAQLNWTIGQYNQLDIESSLIKDYNLNCVRRNNKLYLTQLIIIE